MLPREEAVALVRRLIDAAHRGDLALFASVYADDAVMVSPVFGVVTGRDRIVATWKQLLSTFSELAIEVADILIDGDRIAVLSSVSTMDRAGWFGLAPTGGPIGYRLVLLLTVRGGAIVRDERIYDSAGIVERLEKARLDKELRMAADVQHALLGRKAHAGGFCESVGDSIPCRAIGGDFFEFLQLPSNRIGIAMGDVSGKGPAAALLAAMIQGMLAAESSAGDGPAQTMTRLNRRLAARRLDARFATLVYAVLSPGGRLVYANAGHNAPALATGAGIRRLTVGGPILGAFPEAVFEEEVLRLDPQDTLVMFTDGVTEARNAADDEFGDERLLACVDEHAAAPAALLLNRIFAAVREFSGDADPTDDVTVTVTRVL